MKIGVLSLQGAFAEHEKMCGASGADSFEIRRKNDVETDFDGLIIPGGESTVMGKLLRELDLFEPLKEMISGGFPVMGTCAGLILLAKNIVNDDKIHLATMDVAVRRNAYGRQLGSFYTSAEFAGIGVIPMTFIRAPYIESVTDGAEVLASVEGRIVAARQKNQLATAFHPELNGNLAVHKYFIDNIIRNG